MEKSWILVGMMGAGKSAIGRALATESGREFIDTDSLLQNRFGRPISHIFEIYGEEAFRDHETSILKSLTPGATVVSTGGGVVLKECNWAELHRLGVTIYLEATLKTLITHLEASKKKRPLLEGDHWEDKVGTILSARKHLYQQADLTVSVDDADLPQVLARVMDALKRTGNLAH